jgi:hypothetical protein
MKSVVIGRRTTKGRQDFVLQQANALAICR